MYFPFNKEPHPPKKKRTPLPIVKALIVDGARGGVLLKKKLSVSEIPFAYLVRSLKHCPATPENTQETELAVPRNTEPEHENCAFLNLALHDFPWHVLVLLGRLL